MNSSKNELVPSAISSEVNLAPGLQNCAIDPSRGEFLKLFRQLMISLITRSYVLCLIALISAWCFWPAISVNAAETNANPYAPWPKGPPADPAFFPIAVWLQAPSNADRYRQAGFNTYVALWRGPTEEQLAALRKAGMRLICEQNTVALRHLDDATIIGWMHGDEPDNAQSLPRGEGYGPPIPAEKIVADYQRIRTADPSRPVMLNLGQGVAWDGWYGRGVRSNHPEDYPEYIKGGDIVSFDIYPANHDHKDIAGQLWYVGRGVERLIKWSNGSKVIWNCLECSAISDPARKPTPQQVRCEAWMSIIHGSRGLIYFVHQFKPTFREAALFDDSAMLAAVTDLNQQITKLAPVLNRPSLTSQATVQSINTNVPIALMTKKQGNELYLFTAAMRAGNTKAKFMVTGLSGRLEAEVLGEHRSLPLEGDQFTDEFATWDARVYRVHSQPR